MYNYVTTLMKADINEMDKHLLIVNVNYGFIVLPFDLRMPK